MFARAMTHLRQIDWRIFMGIIITVIWLIGGIVYVRGSNFSQTTIYDILLNFAVGQHELAHDVIGI